MTPASAASLTFTVRPGRWPIGPVVVLFALAGPRPLLAAGDASGPAPEGQPPHAEQPSPVVPPAPMTGEARTHYDQGLRLYGDHDFPAAIREFEAGFALEPRREFLFAEAQAYRLAGDCARAIPLYERFLGSGPSPLQVDATRLALDRCARLPPVKPPLPVAPQPRVAAAPVPAAPVASRSPPWWHDRWALGALGAGLASTGVGVAFVLAAHSAADQANLSTHYGDYSRLWDTAERRQVIGVTALATGGALLALGGLRYAWVRRHGSQATKGAGAQGDALTLRSFTALPLPTAGGAGVMAQVNF